MPTVPVYNNATVAPAPIPAPYDQGLNPRILAEGQAGPREQMALGQALQGASNTLTNEQVEAQNMANQVRVDDALNKVRQAQQQLTYDPNNGYANKTGSAALDPDPLGRSLPQQYSEQLQDTISSTAASLGNDAQRRVFNEHAASLATQFTGNVQQHMLQQYRQFGLETQQGTIKLAADAAKQNWDNPDQIKDQVQSAAAAVWKAGQIAGEPGNLTQAKIQQTTSAIHLGVIDAALQNNEPGYALAYINTKKGEMTADDLLKANGVIKQDLRARVATSTAQNAMTTLQSKIAPSNADLMTQITAQSESGNKDLNPDGTPVTSSAGAVGKMQVMNGTNTDPGYGVKPAQDDSLAERARVGKDYLMAMVKNYGGDPAKAWAAYNAGPAAVDKAVADAKTSGGNWLASMPQETQVYVAKNMDALQKGTVSKIPSQQDVHDLIRQQLGANPDPHVLQASLAEGTRQYNDFMNNRKVQGENTVQQAQQWLIQNQGNFPALPPDMKAAITQYAPDKWDNLQTFAKGIANPVKADNLPAYYDAVAHPEELAKMSDSTFQHFALTNFTEATGKQVANLRQNQLDGKEDLSSGSLNRPALNTALNNRLTSIGIDPNPKDLGGKQQVGSIQKFITDGIFQQQQQLGRKMSAQEVSDFVDTTMAKNVNFRNTFLGITTSVAPQNMLTMKVGDIPDNTVDQIKAALAQRGNTKPTDDQILRTYWTSKK